MISLSITNHKGGTGKTTTVIHVAAALGLSDKRVLVVDLDPQGFLTRMLGCPEPPEERSSLVLFDPSVDVRTVEAIHLKSFDLLPSSSVLTKVMRRLNKPTDVFWIKEATEKGLDYDIVIYDTAAAVTVFSLNALVASRHVLIPVTPEHQPVIGAEQTYQTVKLVQDKLNPSLTDPIFLCTQVDARKGTHKAYWKYLQKQFGTAVMDTVIRTNAALSVTHNDGTTTFDHDPASRGARDYANATDALLRRIAARENRNGKDAAEPIAMPAESETAA